ncbi:hypothetical protein GVAV_002672 [Gurleya vavrai]
MHFEIFKENDGFFNTFLLHKFEFFYIPVNEYFIVLDSNKKYQRELSFSALLENSSKIDLFFKLEIEKMKEHVANFPTKEKIILDHALKTQEKHQNKSIFDLGLNYYFNTIASENLLLKFIKNNSGLYELIKNLIKNSKCLDFKNFIVSNRFINQNDKSFDVISEKIKNNFLEGKIDFINILSLAYEISENKIVFTKTDCVIAFNLFCINLLDNDANSIVFFDECKFFKIFLNDKKIFDEMHYNIGFAQILYFIYTFSVLTNLDWINFLNNRKNLENVYIDHKYAKKSVNEDNSISLKIRKNFLVLLKHDLRKIFFLLIEPMLMGKNFVHYYTIIMLEHILIYKVMNNVKPSKNLIFERIQKNMFFFVNLFFLDLRIFIYHHDKIQTIKIVQSDSLETLVASFEFKNIFDIPLKLNSLLSFYTLNGYDLNTKIYFCYALLILFSKLEINNAKLIIEVNRWIENMKNLVIFYFLKDRYLLIIEKLSNEYRLTTMLQAGIEIFAKTSQINCFTN